MAEIDPIARQKVLHVKCKKSLLFFSRYFFKEVYKKKFVVNSHHELISETLEKVIKGDIKRLIINMPPRYGKTQLAVKYFIAHCLGLNPSAKFIHLSAADDLALDNSEEIRDLVSTEYYQEVFPNVTLNRSTTGKKKWYTVDGGGVYATSAGGQITGFGAGSFYEKNEDDLNEFLTDIEQKEDFGGAIITSKYSNLRTTLSCCFLFKN